ncbi:MAG: protease inhibitor I42 family protein [Anaerolineae bacterium]|jgi:inhibitor of cysteine peptidase
MRTFEEPADTIEISEGETFAVTLPANPTTGYIWHLDTESRHLEVEEEHFDAGGAPGAAGVQVFVLRARKTGHTWVTCEYRRSWQETVRETRRFRVEIS